MKRTDESNSCVSQDRGIASTAQETYREIDPIWTLVDELTIHEAAALMAGFDPEIRRRENLAKTSEPTRKRLRATERALVAAVNTKAIKPSRLIETPVLPGPDDVVQIDPERTTILDSELRGWLAARNFSNEFYFPADKTEAPYLDPKHAHYSPKLAAAVRVWMALKDDDNADERFSPRNKIIKWLNVRAAHLELLNDDESPNKEAIEKQIAKVVNWKLDGGAPKTTVAAPKKSGNR